MTRAIILLAGGVLCAGVLVSRLGAKPPAATVPVPDPAPVQLAPAPVAPAPFPAEPPGEGSSPVPEPAAPRSPDEEQRAAQCARWGSEPSLEAKWELLARVVAEAPRVREAAALALASRNTDPDVRHALEQRIRIDPVKNVRVAAARALGR